MHTYAYIYLFFVSLKQPCNEFLSAEEGSHIFNNDKNTRLKVDHMCTVMSSLWDEDIFL